ncbi:NUDIX domain-containing protein [Bacillus sp. ISL-47]|uniref:NUDIX hydrolase n=1 Tax=Bacillus sp. ISL-47 TaxID=2819130 RepID=UPI001BE60A5C|nr:NUDIX domain-containing protein [Bacillus sp. ISL-47]MBT2687223.1 NUDIX domain-containing protein [Bacillus sp. ISL-47]
MTQNGIVLVASVAILMDSKVLMIKENKPLALNKWNFPSGRIERGEDILTAACREVKEETGFEVKLTQSTGVYHFISSTNHQVILFHFIAEIIGGSLKLEEEEITDSKWVQLSELGNFDEEELREAKVLKQIMDAVLDEKFFPLEIFKEKLNK